MESLCKWDVVIKRVEIHVLIICSSGHYYFEWGFKNIPKFQWNCYVNQINFKNIKKVGAVIQVIQWGKYLKLWKNLYCFASKTVISTLWKTFFEYIWHHNLELLIIRTRYNNYLSQEEIFVLKTLITLITLI